MSTLNSDAGRAAPAAGERRILTAVIVLLLGTATWFRLVDLSSIPGISGDEGWWGIQALAWLSDRPYETHTTSGNPIDLFFLVPLAFVHALAPPSFVLLRALPAVVNLLALPVGFWLVRRLYGATTAWIQTVTLAILPTAIAHSRICQDPSQTVFWTGLVIYLSLLGFEDRRRAWAYRAAAVLVFPVALWTHPTNVFVFPFLVLPIAAAVRSLLRARASPILVTAAVVLLAGGAIGVSIALYHVAEPNAYLNRPWLTLASARMIDGAQWFEFAANNVRLFNGVTIYHYFSGAHPPTLAYDVGFVAVASLALWGLLLGRGGPRRGVDYALIAACAGTWLGFYAFAGPKALRPHAERWGLCLIVPFTLVVARGLAAWIGMPRVRRWTIAAASLIASSVLASFYTNYFREFRTTGGRSHPTYITARPEPKQQALDVILARGTGAPVMIVAQQWWLERPMAYLAAAHPAVSVSPTLPADGQAGLHEALRDGRLFFVEFEGTPELARAADWIRDRGLRAERTAITDASGRDHLQILQVTR
jgi:hypothetical protein